MPLDLVLTGAPDEVHNSAIVRLVFSEPGVVCESYDWKAPYTNGLPNEDGWPASTNLPLSVTADMLSGPGYPAGIVDLELSNVLFGSTFGSGALATLRLRVPADFGFTGPLYVAVVPDTLANGFDVLPIDGGVFTINVMEHPLRRGDTNCDQMVDFKDINPFVLALSNPSVYVVRYPECPIANADINGDGSVNFKDINPLVVLLTGDN